MSWDDPMRLALAEAQAALAGDDVPVGAVVLDESGTVIGTGRNTREAEGDPTGHAEVVALRAAAAIFGAYDDKLGAVGSLGDVVRDRRLNHRPEVVAGVLAAESTALLDGFFARHRLPGRHEAP